ncbi:hypothetical protein QJ854_gp077 [Moumouvirus goulette]|uniref:Uncharacterized protein n=1 Tax=Moumouvirus goulette TaxID=1247379 RepID=M1NNR4_9VIRU|nr:hypothetical protein QJ854_gp077 [Moumouvirus goulette]AGF85705.1 hypothetical protein glt_00902 [Moumouvirus goulette]
MKLGDFINFRIFKNFSWDIGTKVLKCDHDKNHKIIKIDRKNKDYPPLNKSEPLYLIKQARLSFLTYKKIKCKELQKVKDKYDKEIEEEMKEAYGDSYDEDYVKCEYDELQVDKAFYLSSDKKYYCFYLCVIYTEEMGLYVFGILEKETGKYLIYECNDTAGCIRHYYYNIDDCEFSNAIWNRSCLAPFNAISYKTNDMLSGKSKPDEIIDSIDDYFNTIYDELYKN